MSRWWVETLTTGFPWAVAPFLGTKVNDLTDLKTGRVGADWDGTADGSSTGARKRTNGE
jgi:hypothetical protein